MIMAINQLRYPQEMLLQAAKKDPLARQKITKLIRNRLHYQS
jgi:hypothetical protein